MVYNIFISHAWDYNDEYYTLEKWLDQGINWKNMSIPEHDAKDAKSDSELKQLIDNSIRNSSIFLIISGMYISYGRKWIEIELDIAKKYGKPIIAIQPRGNQKTPQIIQESANEIVKWQSKSIIDAIKKY